MPSDLKQRIQAATLKSLTARNRYNDQVTAQLTQALKQAEDEVARSIPGQLHAAQGDDPGGGDRRDYPQRHSRFGRRR